MATRFMIYCTQPIPADVNPDNGEALTFGNVIPKVTSFELDGPNNGFLYYIGTTAPGFIPRDMVLMIHPYEVDV